jgi:hypothetical protein
VHTGTTSAALASERVSPRPPRLVPAVVAGALAGLVAVAIFALPRGGDSGSIRPGAGGELPESRKVAASAQPAAMATAPPALQTPPVPPGSASGSAPPAQRPPARKPAAMPPALAAAPPGSAALPAVSAALPAVSAAPPPVSAARPAREPFY